MSEKGIFFCENCGGTILQKLTYEEKPKDSCKNCGFNNWIFEPTEEVVYNLEDIKANLKKIISDATMFDVMILINDCGWLIEQLDQVQENNIARPLEEWHEDYGDAIWWTFPIVEPPYVGSPLWNDWPKYHTHWTPIIVPMQPKE